MQPKAIPEVTKKEKKLDDSIKVEKSLKLKEEKSKNSFPPASLIDYGTGRRKNSVARVWVKVGKGHVTVNKKVFNKYFPNEAHRIAIQKPLEVTQTLGQYDIICTVKGGGCSGQAGAIMHGVSRALVKLVPDFHKILRDYGLLTRDSRMVERKKYGRSGARKRYQFSKR